MNYDNMSIKNLDVDAIALQCAAKRILDTPLVKLHDVIKNSQNHINNGNCDLTDYFTMAIYFEDIFTKDLKKEELLSLNYLEL